MRTQKTVRESAPVYRQLTNRRICQQKIGASGPLLGGVETGPRWPFRCRWWLALLVVCPAACSRPAIAENSADIKAEKQPSIDGRNTHEAVQRTDPNSVEVHNQLLAKAKQGKIDVYFQGDSISRRWGATDYPEFLSHWNKTFHGWNAANFAWGGDNTHNILWRMQNGELDGVNPKVVVLQAGTNNLPWQGPVDDATVADVVTGIKAILAEFHGHDPDATIVLTGLFPRPQNPQAAEAILEINQQLAKLADGDRVRFIDINSSLVNEQGEDRSGMFTDGLHLDLAGYEVWASALQPVLTELLGPPAEHDHAPPPTGDPSAAK